MQKYLLNLPYIILNLIPKISKLKIPINLGLLFLNFIAFTYLFNSIFLIH